MPRSQAIPNGTAADRVRSRIADMLDRRGMTQRDLVKHVRAKYGAERSEAWLTEILKGRQDLRLADLDAVADGLDILPSELVRRSETELMEIYPSERRVILYLRALPGKIRDQWISLLDYLFTGKETSGQPNLAAPDVPFRPNTDGDEAFAARHSTQSRTPRRRSAR